MIYFFDFDEVRGDVIIATYSCEAQIERCPIDPDNWRVASISISGETIISGRSVDYTVDATDPLYPRLMAHLNTIKVSAEIDCEWTDHLLEELDDVA